VQLKNSYNNVKSPKFTVTHAVYKKLHEPKITNLSIMFIRYH